MDLKKALDHKTLVCPMSGIALSWFQSYLASRCHTTSVGRSLSNSRRVTVGVPKGFILGPLLFLKYSNNVNKSLQYASIALFADDAALSYSLYSNLGPKSCMQPHTRHVHGV